MEITHSVGAMRTQFKQKEICRMSSGCDGEGCADCEKAMVQWLYPVMFNRVTPNHFTLTLLLHQWLTSHNCTAGYSFEFPWPLNSYMCKSSFLNLWGGKTGCWNTGGDYCSGLYLNNNVCEDLNVVSSQFLKFTVKEGGFWLYLVL